MKAELFYERLKKHYLERSLYFYQKYDRESHNIEDLNNGIIWEQAYELLEQEWKLLRILKESSNGSGA